MKDSKVTRWFPNSTVDILDRQKFKDMPIGQMFDTMESGLCQKISGKSAKQMGTEDTLLVADVDEMFSLHNPFSVVVSPKGTRFRLYDTAPNCINRRYHNMVRATDLRDGQKLVQTRSAIHDRKIS